MSFLSKNFIIIGFLLIVIISGSTIGYFYIQSQASKIYSFQAVEKTFVIHKGDSAKTVAFSLERAQLIKNDFYFLFYLWQNGLTNKLQAGEYLLRPNMSIIEIVKMFIEGQVKPNWIQITIPEGFNLKKIDARLAEAGLIKTGDLLSFSSVAFQLKSLEGYLFPDTYRFDKTVSLEEIVKKMLDNFDGKITADVREQIQKQGRSFYEILTMASILEKEVKSDEDRKIVAGIFWKRIKNGQPLESCATIAYILGVDKWRYSYDDTRIKSPYNTYLNKGLPPTPINNPGLATISAALTPIETDYNYFLTDPETGDTIFSKTFAEHNKNKVKYLK